MSNIKYLFSQKYEYLCITLVKPEGEPGASQVSQRHGESKLIWLLAYLKKKTQKTCESIISSDNCPQCRERWNQLVVIESRFKPQQAGFRLCTLKHYDLLFFCIIIVEKVNMCDKLRHYWNSSDDIWKKKPLFLSKAGYTGYFWCVNLCYIKVYGSPFQMGLKRIKP